MHTDLLNMLPEHSKQSNGSIYVFPGKNGKRMVDCRKRWKNTLMNASARNLRFHDIRHTFATKFLIAGNSLAQLQIILGHKNIKTTMRYSHLANEHEHLRHTHVTKKTETLLQKLPKNRNFLPNTRITEKQTKHYDHS